MIAPKYTCNVAIIYDSTPNLDFLSLSTLKTYYCGSTNYAVVGNYIDNTGQNFYVLLTDWY